ncbi:MAG: ABC transporter substrate-binding protein [Halanaerobiaceae bacterium]
MKWRKEIVLLGIILILLISGTVSAQQEITVNTPPVPASLPLLWAEEEGQTGDMELKVKLSSDHSRNMNLLAEGEIDFAVTGSNVGAKFYNRGMDIKLLNINTWAVDYLLTRGFKAENWEDLKGHSLGVLVEGGPLDFLTRYFLKQNQIDSEEVEIINRPLPGAARHFIRGDMDSIILPEPQVTATMRQGEDVHLSLDIQEEWGEFHDGDERIPFVGLFVNGDFAAENPDMVEKLDELYARGVEWMKENPEAAARLAGEHFDQPASVMEEALQRVEIALYSEEETATLIERFFTPIVDMYPDMIGGQLPDEEFYY